MHVSIARKAAEHMERIQNELSLCHVRKLVDTLKVFLKLIELQ